VLYQQLQQALALARRDEDHPVRAPVQEGGLLALQHVAPLGVDQ
jgi:hypothetical protein